MKFTDGKEIQYASFNQDCTRLCIGTKDAYHTFSIDPFKHNRSKLGEGTSILEVLFLTSLGAHVGCGDASGSSMRTLRVINTQREKEIMRMHYPTAVLNVRLNRERIVVVIETAIFIYDIKNMHLLHTIGSTPKNPKGVCALASGHIPASSASSSLKFNNFLAYPGSEEKGEVIVYDVVNQKAICVIEAHTTRVSCLALSNLGDRLVTASEKGTVFRVYNTLSKTKLAEFRRGLASHASISSMALSPLSSWLCVASERETIHIFKMPESGAEEKKEDTSTWTGYFLSTVSAVAEYLPTSVTEHFTQERDFAHFSLPLSPSLSSSLAPPAQAQQSSLSLSPLSLALSPSPPRAGACVALAGEENAPLVHVATSDGILYTYAVDAERGGECHVVAQKKLTLTDEGERE